MKTANQKKKQKKQESSSDEQEDKPKKKPKKKQKKQESSSDDENSQQQKKQKKQESSSDDEQKDNINLSKKPQVEKKLDEQSEHENINATCCACQAAKNICGGKTCGCKKRNKFCNTTCLLKKSKCQNQNTS